MSAPNRPFRTQFVPYGKAAIDQAARLIVEGLPVAVPTETVYGLAADATSAAAVGLESTIVTVEEKGVRLLRPGPIDFAEIGAIARLASAARPHGIEAPGQLASHYAPRKPVRLEAVAAEAGEWLIGFGAIAGDDNLSASGDLDEAAAKLFAALHRADRQNRAGIAVAPVPDTGIGAAINDRLRRAAAPRG